MAEVLSQNEIDALLEALSSGEVDVNEIEDGDLQRKVKKYDFRNPQKIAKDQLRTLEIIHENFGRLFQTFLSGYLRAPVKIEVLTVDQFAYSEFNNAISNPAFLPIIAFKPLSGQIIMDISTKIAFGMIERLLGGDGERSSGGRSFTEIELTLLKRVLIKMMGILAEAWEHVIDLEPSLEKVEINSQFAQVVSPSETVALATMNVSIGSIEGMLNICIPHIVIEPILNKLSTKLWFSRSQKIEDEEKENDKKLMTQRLKKAAVTMRAQLGSTTATLREVLSLNIGDVIKLETNPNGKVKILTGSVEKFYGVPGTKRNKIAVKITDSIKDGDETDGR